MKRVPGFCALCRSRCGAIGVVDGDRLVALEPDPSHPTGAALCAKGRAAPELVHHEDRLLHPLRRTAPKGVADPGWVRIGWDEALDTVATRLKAVIARHGPEAVAYAMATPSGTALSDTQPWIERLMNALGTPNNCYSSELCNWHKDHAHAFTYGCAVPTPDHAQAGVIMLWGFNPSTAWLAQAVLVAEAKAKGAALVVVDPRRAGLANKADLWLRVRPGTDGALALGVAHQMIANGWYDAAFVRRWSNGPLLVRGDTGALLRARDLGNSTNEPRYVAWDATTKTPALYNPATRRYEGEPSRLALFDRLNVTIDGRTVECRPAFALYAERCAAYGPSHIEAVTGVSADQVTQLARLLFERRPLAYYLWTGVGQHTNATQTDRAIALLAMLTGSFDAPGGNVRFAKFPVADISGRDLLAPAQMPKTLGRDARPLGPPADGWITSLDLYRAMLEHKPYRVAALMGFGANLLLSHPEADHGAKALDALEFYVHSDLFLNESARHADIVLPIASTFEREGLRCGFELNEESERLVQLRPAFVPPRGESKPDIWVVFELAKRLGLGDRFWHGDIDASYRAMLAPIGVTLEQLRAEPRGIRVPLETKHRKYESTGFQTPSGLIEVFAERLAERGYDPLPAHKAPALSPEAVPDIASRFPLRLSCAKTPTFCHSQHRNLPSLRAKEPDPTIDMHPETASTRGLKEGDWARITTPSGQASARVSLRRELEPGVVIGRHGWWRGLTAGDGNYNGLISHAAIDPISGAPGMRSSLCQVEALG
ncbi:MAG: molybdopterin oxidoreductase [Alphaproteobacteria bacterium]|nr:molybdopterin oxidoreductase [Alphaproteobacteria bacterium]